MSFICEQLWYQQIDGNSVKNQSDDEMGDEAEDPSLHFQFEEFNHLEEKEGWIHHEELSSTHSDTTYGQFKVYDLVDNEESAATATHTSQDEKQRWLKELQKTIKAGCHRQLCFCCLCCKYPFIDTKILNGKNDKKFLKDKGVEFRYSPDVLCAKMGEPISASNIDSLAPEEISGFLLKNRGYDFGCSFALSSEAPSVAIDFKAFSRYLDRVDLKLFLADTCRLADYIIKVCTRLKHDPATFDVYKFKIAPQLMSWTRTLIAILSHSKLDQDLSCLFRVSQALLYCHLNLMEMKRIEVSRQTKELVIGQFSALEVIKQSYGREEYTESVKNLKAFIIFTFKCGLPPSFERLAPFFRVLGLLKFGNDAAGGVVPIHFFEINQLIAEIPELQTQGSINTLVEDHLEAYTKCMEQNRAKDFKKSWVNYRWLFPRSTRMHFARAIIEGQRKRGQNHNLAGAVVMLSINDKPEEKTMEDRLEKVAAEAGIEREGDSWEDRQAFYQKLLSHLLSLPGQFQIGGEFQWFTPETDIDACVFIGKIMALSYQFNYSLKSTLNPVIFKVLANEKIRASDMAHWPSEGAPYEKHQALILQCKPKLEALRASFFKTIEVSKEDRLSVSSEEIKMLICGDQPMTCDQLKLCIDSPPLPVIDWLWQILEQECSPEKRSQIFERLLVGAPSLPFYEYSQLKIRIEVRAGVEGRVESQSPRVVTIPEFQTKEETRVFLMKW